MQPRIDIDSIMYKQVRRGVQLFRNSSFNSGIEQESGKRSEENYQELEA